MSETKTPGKAAGKAPAAGMEERQIRIVARRDGFRRCGVAHSAAPAFHPCDRFTADELERLRADPMLIVDVVDGAGRLAAGPVQDAPSP